MNLRCCGIAVCIGEMLFSYVPIQLLGLLEFYFSELAYMLRRTKILPSQAKCFWQCCLFKNHYFIHNLVCSNGNWFQLCFLDTVILSKRVVHHLQIKCNITVNCQASGFPVATIKEKKKQHTQKNNKKPTKLNSSLSVYKIKHMFSIKLFLTHISYFQLLCLDRFEMFCIRILLLPRLILRINFIQCE